VSEATQAAIKTLLAGREPTADPISSLFEQKKKRRVMRAFQTARNRGNKGESES
jgi:hypothetical protein